MAKLLLADENFPFPTVEHLRQMGHDVVTLLDLGKAEQAMPDKEVLQLATDLHRAILTFNRRDFIRLHRQSEEHAGIIVCTLDINFHRLADNIDRAMQKFPSLEGRLLRISRE